MIELRWTWTLKYRSASLAMSVQRYSDNGTMGLPLVALADYRTWASIVYCFLIVDAHGLEQLPNLLAVEKSRWICLCPTVGAKNQGNEKDLECREELSSSSR